MSDRPAFEIRSIDGRAIEIYAHGAVNGLEHAPGLSIIVNRIPLMVAEVAEIAEGHMIGAGDDAIELCARFVEGLAGMSPQEIAAELRKLKKGKSLLEEAA